MRPSGSNKSKVIEDVTGKSADYTGVTVIDTLGREDMSFLFECVTVTGGDASNYMSGKMQGSRTRGGPFTDIPGLATALKLNGAGTGGVVGEIVPTAANAPGIVLPRFIRGYFTETGSVTAAHLRLTMYYRRNRRSGPPGRGSLGDSANLP